MGEAVDIAKPVPSRVEEGKKVATLICGVLGLGSLVSWNSIMSIADYYYQVFPDYHPSRVLTLVYQPFAFTSIVLLAYNESRINTRSRVIFGYVVFAASTFLLLVLDLATSGGGGIGPYIVLCALIGSFGLADAFVQGGMIGDLSLMCAEFVQSYLTGLGVAGTLTSALRLITVAAFAKSNNGLRKSTLLYLALSVCVQVLCVGLYTFVFPKLPIVKYYRSKAASEGSKTVKGDLAAAGIKTKDVGVDLNAERLSLKELLKQNYDYAISLFLTYVLTLSIFPGFLYENTGTHQLGAWYPLVLVAMYNLLDTIARFLPTVKCLFLKSRKWITVSVLARFLLIPAFYFTAKYASQGYMIFLTSFLGLTNGYLTTCILSEAPRRYKGPEQNALGNLLTVFLLGGIFAGVCLDWLWLIGTSNAF